MSAGRNITSVASAILTAAIFSAGIAYGAAAPEARDVRNPDPAAVPSGTYVADPEHTRILWMANHHGYSNFFGMFTKIESSLVLDQANFANSKLTATVDTSAIVTVVNPPARNDWFMGNLGDSDMFEFKKYPTSTFTSTKMERVAPNKARVTGDLTLHGITKPAVLDVTFNTAGEGPLPGYRLGFEGRMVLNRYDWDMNDHGPTSGGPGVSKDVTLTIEAEMVAKR